MSDYLIYLTEEDFKKQTSCPKNALSIDFNHDSFKKGPTFSLAMREQAIKYCQRRTDKKFKSLLIETKDYFIVWTQENIID